MRITTRVVYQLTDDPEEFIELERESYEYDGPVAQAGGGGGGDTTTVQKADPWGPLQPYIQQVLPQFMSAGQNIAEYYPGQTYANFDPLQEQAMQGQLGYAAGIQPTINNMFAAGNLGMMQTNPYYNPALAGAGGLQQQYGNFANDPAYMNALGASQYYGNLGNNPYLSMMGGMTQRYGNMGLDPALANAAGLTNLTGNMGGDLGLQAAMGAYGNIGGMNAAYQNALGVSDLANRMVADPMSDPTIQAYYEAAARPLTAAYEQQVGQAIAGDAVGAGGLGGSRQGVAEGAASGAYLDSMKDLSAEVANNAFNSALAQQLGAGQLLGSTEAQLAGNQLNAAGMLNTAYGRNIADQLNAGQMLTGAYGQAAGLDQNAANMFGQAYGQAADQDLAASQLLGDMYGQASQNQFQAGEMFNTAYTTGLEAMMQNMTMMPQTLQTGMMPYNIMSQIGGQYQGMDQQAIQEAMDRYNYNNNVEFSRYNDMFNTLMGQGFGSSTTTGPNPNQSNTAANMLGGATLGLAANALPASMVGSSAFATLGGLMGPFALPLIGAGLLGAFG